MRPALLDIKSEGDLGGEKIALTLDTNSLAHIMSVLTDLYSDQAMAVIREYSTNAFDAHVEAGISAPIEVSTPNHLSPFFKVKDYGVGLSFDDVVNIYSRYGASTKRDTDGQTGMLGLGCKSALTFTSQFSIVSVKDGIKIIVSISRTPDGAGQMEVVDQSLTDESNGVEVIVPVGVSVASAFSDKVMDFFQYWEPGTVLVNGSAPFSIRDKENILQLDDNLILVPGSGADVIVMGNVPYPAKEMNIFYDAYSKPYRAVAWVEMGEVHFPPSRESLVYDAITKSTIAEINAKIARNIVTELEAQVADAETWQKAVSRLVFGYRSVMKRVDVKYKGLLLEERPRFTERVWHYEIDGVGKKSTNVVSDIYYNTPELIVTGFTKASITTHDRKKVRLYIESIGAHHHNVLFMDKMDPRFAALPTVDWETIRAIKVEKSAGSEFKSFEVLSTRGYLETVENLDDKRPILYYMPASRKLEISRLRDLAVTHQIVKISTRHETKFKEFFDKAEKLETFLFDKFNLAKASIPEYAKIKTFSDYYSAESFQGIPPDSIEDPELAEYLRKTEGRVVHPEINEYHKYRQYCGIMQVEVESIRQIKNPFSQKYPLVGTGRPANIAHAIIYINTIYQLEKNDNSV
jgi:hypothetical protein